ncbi:30S ribosomal protein S2 [Sulfurihydrogenibium subterraneum]|uniref:30S ribosomal protein S2 n=1 Tax=Sulfurihydrogenibium subterraneum TaxID=171121 RepID=UPI00048DFB37|nr:30S ribosomal protein S2 [Sulfurihydrogenibium subterraneum]
MSVEISMRELLEAGVHFGHQVRRWNPKMKPYIYTKRNGIHIIDLSKSVPLFKQAIDFIINEVGNGAEVLFLGTKKQAQAIIEEQAQRCGAYYVNYRWLGGMFTNFQTVRKSIAKLRKLQKMEAEGAFEILPKKEVMKLKKQKEKLEKYLKGIVDMNRVPDIIFVVDTVREDLAVTEANKLGVTVVAIADTNCDPDKIDYPIPGNDDAIKAISLITSKIADAVIEGKKMRESLGTAVETKTIEEELLAKESEVVESGYMGAKNHSKEERLSEIVEKEAKESVEEAKEEL